MSKFDLDTTDELYVLIRAAADASSGTIESNLSDEAVIVILEDALVAFRHGAVEKSANEL